MFQILLTKTRGDGKVYIEAAATSSDTLPENDEFITGSSVLLVDTKTIKFFNEAAAAGSKWA